MVKGYTNINGWRFAVGVSRMAFRGRWIGSISTTYKIAVGVSRLAVSRLEV